MSWNAHIDNVSKKANNTTAFLHRNLSSCPKHVKVSCYRTFARPQVEYGATVWDRHTTVNIIKLEGVQNRAARFVTSDYSYTSSVTSMINDLGWESLHLRRQQANAVMIYRLSSHWWQSRPRLVYNYSVLLQGVTSTTGRLPIKSRSFRQP